MSVKPAVALEAFDYLARVLSASQQAHIPTDAHKLPAFAIVRAFLEEATASQPRINGHPVQVYADIALERTRQDAKWGGPKHDDDHGAEDWKRLRAEREDRLTKAMQWDGRFDPQKWLTETRKNVIEIAALCVAQVESLDRSHPNGRIKERPSATAAQQPEVTLTEAMLEAINDSLRDNGYMSCDDCHGRGCYSVGDEDADCGRCNGTGLSTEGNEIMATLRALADQ